MCDHHSLECPHCHEYIPQHLAKFHTCYYCDGELPSIEDVLNRGDQFDEEDWDE